MIKELNRACLLVGLMLVSTISTTAQAGESADAPDLDVWERPVSISFLHPSGEVNYLPLTEGLVPLFRAEVDGVEVCATIDTGANSLVVSTRLAHRLALEELMSLPEVDTPAGTVAGHVTSPAEFEVTGQFRFESPAVAIELPEAECADGLPLDVVFGTPTFGQMSIFVDNPNARIAFLPAGAISPEPWRHLKIDWIDNQVDGSIDGRPVRMLLDTGVTEPLFAKQSALETYFPDRELLPHEPVRTSGGVVTETSRIEGILLGVGGAKATVRAQIYPGTDWGTTIVLGYAFFGKNPVIFDAANQAIYLLAEDATQ